VQVNNMGGGQEFPKPSGHQTIPMAWVGTMGGKIQFR